MAEYEKLADHIDKIKEDYLFGVVQDDGSTKFLSVSKLAKLYNVSESTLSKKVSRDKWKKQREDIELKVHEKVKENKSDFAAETIVKNDKMFSSTANKMRRLIDRKLDEIETRLDNDERVYAGEFKDLSISLRNNYEIVKISEGEEPNDNIATGLNNLANTLETSRQKRKKTS